MALRRGHTGAEAFSEGSVAMGKDIGDTAPINRVPAVTRAPLRWESRTLWVTNQASVLTVLQCSAAEKTNSHTGGWRGDGWAQA